MSVKPFFSVVMPSYLGEYQGAASNRPEKFRRAVESFLSQTFMDAELIVVADGCEETIATVQHYYGGSARVRSIAIEKQPIWCGSVRNAGIRSAQGEWITYLDTDDYLDPEHLSIIRSGLNDSPPPNGWAYFDDWYWREQEGRFKVRTCDIDRPGYHGTANLVHRPGIAWWPQNGHKVGYLHDKYFTDELKKLGPGVKLPTPRYMVCHDVKKVGNGARLRYETKWEV